MQDTVDQVYGAVPHTLANVTEDARRAAGQADAPAAGRLGHSGSQGSSGKDPGSMEWRDGATLSPFDISMAMQRAQDKTEQMLALAGALDELLASGALQDATLRGLGIHFSANPHRGIRCSSCCLAGGVEPAEPF